jgi:hypothetical protein
MHRKNGYNFIKKIYMFYVFFKYFLNFILIKFFIYQNVTKFTTFRRKKINFEDTFYQNTAFSKNSEMPSN